MSRVSTAKTTKNTMVDDSAWRIWEIGLRRTRRSADAESRCSCEKERHAVPWNAHHSIPNAVRTQNRPVKTTLKCHAARQRDHRWTEVRRSNGGLRRMPRAVD